MTTKRLLLSIGALWLIGVPLPLAWGFFSFITNFIPNIGFVIGIIPPALIALLDSGWQTMLLVLVVYSVLNVTIQTFIQPRYVGNTVGLSAEMTFMSLVVWAFLLGPLGALLAVPMTLLLRALFSGFRLYLRGTSGFDRGLGLGFTGCVLAVMVTNMFGEMSYAADLDLDRLGVLVDEALNKAPC